MKAFIMMLSFLTIVSAQTTTKTLYNWYNKGQYLKVCNEGFKVFSKHRNDEVFISLYAYGCLNADLLDRLATPIVLLKRSQTARKNAAYFSAILMKKKLLMHALIDKYDISNIKLPASSYILSKVFDLLVASNYDANSTSHTLTDPTNNAITYKLYTNSEESLTKIIIESYENAILKERHIYW